MLPNEIFALSCRAYYDEQGLIVDESNGEFAHCPYPKGMGEKGYYLLHDHHQHQGLLQSEDLGKRCFFIGDVKRWLLTCNPFPDNYFELWDIYEKYVSLHNAELNVKLHAEKDGNGKSINAVKAGEKGGEKGKQKTQKRTELTRICDGAVFTFDCMSDASRTLNLDKSNLSKVCKGKYRNTGGYTARFL